MRGGGGWGLEIILGVGRGRWIKAIGMWSVDRWLVQDVF